MAGRRRMAGVLLVAFSGGVACRAPAPQGSTVVRNPRTAEVPLATVASDWNARLVYECPPTGIWSVAAFPVFEQYASPEVVALDDRGRCLVFVSYSGKWTPKTIIEEGTWLGGLAHGDVDPRLPGAELYVGGKGGNLYQVGAYADGVLDARRVAHFAGHEIHTIVAGELDPRCAGPELFVFTRPGALYRVTPTGADGSFETTRLADLEGRVRGALVIPAADLGRSSDGDGADGGADVVATVSRAGTLELVSVGADGVVRDVVYSAPMGFGRIARAPQRPGRGLVLYTTLDDGRVLRHAARRAGSWDTTTIHHGAQGPRGLVAGRFHADADVECVAVFGYGREVELLTARDDGHEPAGIWDAETIFVDRGRGHGLAVAELDGRNATDELVTCGYGARVVMLARPPGHGVGAASR